MLDVSSINAVSGILAALGVIVGIGFAVLQLRDLVRTRQIALIMGLYTTFLGKELQEADVKVMATEFEDYNDFVKKYGSFTTGKPIHKAIRMIGAFHEGIGVLLHRKLIDIGVIDELYAVAVRWEKMKPLVNGLRKQLNEPKMNEWFEYLYNEIQKRDQTLSAQQ